MKIFPLFLFFLLIPFKSQGIAMELGKVILGTVLAEGASIVYEFGKNYVIEALKLKKETVAAAATNFSSKKEIFNFKKSELNHVVEILKLAIEKMDASFTDLKTLIRKHHFQTHVQFPTQNLILHVELFLSNPINSTEVDLRQTCSNIFPQSFLKTIETMLKKDKWLIEQSDKNPKFFVKLERGIIILVKQLIFAQSVCIQIRDIGSSGGNDEAFYRYNSLKMAESIETLIKNQKWDVQTHHKISTFMDQTLKSFNISEIKKDDPKIYEKIGKNLCQNLTESSELSGSGYIGFFATRNFNNFTVISKNQQYLKINYNDWIIYVFYSKIKETTKSLENLKKSKNIIQNQIIFECKNKSHCILLAGIYNGMFDAENKFIHYSICGNIGVTIGHYPNFLIFEDKSSEKEAESEKEEEILKLDETEFLEFLKTRKSKNFENERNEREFSNSNLNYAKTIDEVKQPEEIKVASSLISNSVNSFHFVNNLFISFFIFYFSF